MSLFFLFHLILSRVSSDLNILNMNFFNIFSNLRRMPMHISHYLKTRITHYFVARIVSLTANLGQQIIDTYMQIKRLEHWSWKRKWQWYHWSLWVTPFSEPCEKSRDWIIKLTNSVWQEVIAGYFTVITTCQTEIRFKL